MSKFKRFSINNSNNNMSYNLDLKLILITIGCYFLNPTIAIVIFAISLSRENMLIAYHAFHSVIVAFFLSVICYCLAFFKIGLSPYVLNIVLKVLLNIFSIYGAYHLLNKKTYNIPFVSNIFKRILQY